MLRPMLVLLVVCLRCVESYLPNCRGLNRAWSRDLTVMATEVTRRVSGEGTSFGSSSGSRSTFKYSKIDKSRRNLYRSILDASGEMNLPSTISRMPLNTTREVVELFAKYVIAQHESKSTNGSLQFEASVKTFKHVYIYINSVSNSPLEVLDEVYTLVQPIVPTKVLIQLKCVQFTAHVRQRNLSYARHILQDILAYYRADQQNRSIVKKSKRRGRFPLNISTVSNLMRLLLAYPTSDNQASPGQIGGGIISIGLSPLSSLEYSAKPPPRHMRGSSGGSGTFMFPLPLNIATFDARRIQQRQSEVVLEIYDQVIGHNSSSDSLLWRCKVSVADRIHEYGARAAIALSRYDKAMAALKKVSGQHMASDNMQRLSLYVLDSLDDHHSQVEQEFACDLCLLQPIELIRPRSPLMQAVVRTLGTSESHYKDILLTCKRDLLVRDPGYALRGEDGLAILRFVARREDNTQQIMFLIDLIWKEDITKPTLLREAVRTIIKASCDLRRARNMHDVQPEGAVDTTLSIRKAEVSVEFTRTLLMIPERVAKALCSSSVTPAGNRIGFSSSSSSTGAEKGALYIINRALEVLLIAYEDSGLGEESWTTLQSIYDYYIGSESEDSATARRGSMAAGGAGDGDVEAQVPRVDQSGQTVWAPDSIILTMALGDNTEHVVQSVVNQIADGVLPGEFLASSLFDAITIEDTTRPYKGSVRSDLLLRLWEDLAAHGIPFVRRGRVLSSALRFAFSRDVKLGLAFAEISIREALVEMKTTRAQSGAGAGAGVDTVGSVLRAVFTTVDALPTESDRERGSSLSLVPLATLSVLYHQYSFLRSSNEIEMASGASSSGSTVLTRLPLDEDLMILGTSIITEGHLSGSSMDTQPSGGRPLRHLSTRPGGVSMLTRLVAFLESCRALDDSALVRLGSRGSSWLGMILTAYDLEQAPQPQHREIALRAFDLSVSSVLTTRMAALGEELSFDTVDGTSTTATGSAAMRDKYPTKEEEGSASLLLRDYLSPEEFATAIKLVSVPLRQEREGDEELSPNAVDIIMRKSRLHYTTSRDLFGIAKSDAAALALLTAASSSRGSYLVSTGFQVILDKIQGGCWVTGRETKLLFEAAVKFNKQTELQSFWADAFTSTHRAGDDADSETGILFEQSTAIHALLEAHIVTSNATGLMSWAQLVVSVSDQAYLPPAALKALLLTYADEERAKDLSCLHELLPLLTQLSARYVPATADPAAIEEDGVTPGASLWGSSSSSSSDGRGALLPPDDSSIAIGGGVGVGQRRAYLPLSMKLLCDTSRLLLHGHRSQDAFALLRYVHPDVWPYDELLRALHFSWAYGKGQGEAQTSFLWATNTMADVLLRRMDVMSHSQRQLVSTFISDETRQGLRSFRDECLQREEEENESGHDPGIIEGLIRSIDALLEEPESMAGMGTEFTDLGSLRLRGPDFLLATSETLLHSLSLGIEPVGSERDGISSSSSGSSHDDVHSRGGGTWPALLSTSEEELEEEEEVEEEEVEEEGGGGGGGDGAQYGKIGGATEVDRQMQRQGVQSFGHAVEKEQVQSGLLALLRLQRLADADTGTSSLPSIQAGTGAWAASSSIGADDGNAGAASASRWLDPESRLSLESFEQEVARLGLSHRQANESPSLSPGVHKQQQQQQHQHQQPWAEAEPEETLTDSEPTSSPYLNRLLRVENELSLSSGTAQGQGLRQRLSAAGAKDSWKASAQKSTNWQREMHMESGGQLVHSDRVVTLVMIVSVERVLLAHPVGQQLGGTVLEPGSSKTGVPRRKAKSLDENDDNGHDSAEEGKSSSNEYWEVCNKARALYGRLREDLFCLPSVRVLRLSEGLLSWCRAVGEVELAVLIIEAVAEMAPDSALCLLPRLYRLLEWSERLPSHREWVSRAFEALSPMIQTRDIMQAHAGDIADNNKGEDEEERKEKEEQVVREFLELSLRSCFPRRQEWAVREDLGSEGDLHSDDGDYGRGNGEEDHPSAPPNVAQVSRRLEVLAAVPGALTPKFSSFLLRQAMHSSERDLIHANHDTIGLSLAVLRTTLYANQYPDDKTCEILAKLLMRNGHSRISAQLFEYLRHQQHLCSLSAYKAWISHLVLEGSQAEIEYFGDSVDVIDHVCALVGQTAHAKRGTRADEYDSRPRLLADFVLLQVANAGCEVDTDTRRRLQNYTPSEASD